MTIHALLEVDVKDERFKAYVAEFEEHKQRMAQYPKAWEEINDKIKAATAAIEGFTSTVTGAGEALESTAGNIAKDLDAARKHASDQERSWRSMATDAKSFAGHIADATKSLLRWGELTGLIGGLIGAGGLYGIDRMAIAAGTERRTAAGLGMSTGQERSLGVNLQRYVDPGAVENGIVGSLSDQTKQVAFTNLGLNQRQELQKGSFQAVIDTMEAVKKKVDATSDVNLGGLLIGTEQFGSLGFTLQDLKRIKAENPAEFAKNMSRTRSDVNVLGYDDKTAKAWQDLQVQLSRAGAEIEAVFVKGLAPLVPGIEHLSQGVVDIVKQIMGDKGLAPGIEALAVDVEDFAKFIGTNEFKSDVQSFVDDMKELAKVIKWSLDWLGTWRDRADMATSIGEGAAAGALIGSVVPGPGTAAGAVVGGIGGAVAQLLFPGHPWGGGGGATAGKVAPNMAFNEAAIHNQLIAAGLSENAAAGVLGNLQQESGFDPNAHNASGHFGLAQWDKNRQAKFKKVFGHDIHQSTLDEQVKFILSEFNGDYGETLAQLKASTSPSQAAKIVDDSYEVSGGGTTARRQANAQQAFNRFASQTPMPANTHAVPGTNVTITLPPGGSAVAQMSQAPLAYYGP